MTQRPAPDQDAEFQSSTSTEPRALGAGATEAEQLVELNALLGRGTTYSGKLHFEGRIRIEGRFSGEIRGEDILVIGEGAEIDGSIRVGVCIVTGGHVRADIRASRAIELYVPAVVHGDLHSPAIFIDRGVQFEGSCKMAPLDATPAPDGPIALPLPSPPPRRDAPPPGQTEPMVARSAERGGPRDSKGEGLTTGTPAGNAVPTAAGAEEPASAIPSDDQEPASQRGQRGQQGKP
jgi:cytoskeletal protein CcmA (bactofilin family)